MLTVLLNSHRAYSFRYLDPPVGVAAASASAFARSGAMSARHSFQHSKETMTHTEEVKEARKETEIPKIKRQQKGKHTA